MSEPTQEQRGCRECAHKIYHHFTCAFFKARLQNYGPVLVLDSERSPERHGFVDTGEDFCGELLQLQSGAKTCGKPRDAEVHKPNPDYVVTVAPDGVSVRKWSAPQSPPEAGVCVGCGHAVFDKELGYCLGPDPAFPDRPGIPCGHRCTFLVPEGEVVAETPLTVEAALAEYKQIAEGLLMLDWILGYELTQEKMEHLDRLRSQAAFLLERDAEDQP